MMEKQGAKQIIEKGLFPCTALALREVRGIGDYTAGAIASIAFNEVVHSLATREISVCIFFSFFEWLCEFSIIIVGCPSCGWKCDTSHQQALHHCWQPKGILNSEEILVDCTILLVWQLIDVFGWSIIFSLITFCLISGMQWADPPPPRPSQNIIIVISMRDEFTSCLHLNS